MRALESLNSLILQERLRREEQIDEEHKIGDKTKETIEGVKQKTVEFEKEHHLMQNILDILCVKSASFIN